MTTSVLLVGAIQTTNLPVLIFPVPGVRPAMWSTASDWFWSGSS